MKNWQIACLMLLASCTHQKTPLNTIDQLKWVDLTYSFDSTTIYWPNNVKPFEHYKEMEGITSLGYFYSSYSFFTPEHGGTHLDAPIHFSANKYTVDEIPLENLKGNAVVIDVSEKALANRDYQVQVDDILNWEKANGTISDNTIILFRTGYGKFYPNRKETLGTEKIGPNAIPELHFPGVHPYATEWLLKNRKIKAIGLDTPSMDYGQSKDFKTHQILLGANKVGFENVANLDQLPAKNIFVIALPMKIGKGTGAPLHIVAGVAN